MTQIHRAILLLCNFEQPLCTVVTASRYIEHFLRLKLYQNQCLYATRQTNRWNFTQDRAVNYTTVDNGRLIHILNHFLDHRVNDPVFLVIVFEIRSRIVHRFLHITVKNVQHLITSSMCVLLLSLYPLSAYKTRCKKLLASITEAKSFYLLCPTRFYFRGDLIAA
ncbi:hypothetical protein FAEPRAA2165_03515 [Faecalibacterium duncaniae]|uniref:Uncharacterized protein n=1 Tax=Faecalibacterium duncaniae (strain DSM 17677 / JCM 31915 / A2-165) TaxID=411483 RepID=C7HAZ9_FAED2|nr:hypothetical protein FAEPRAA2165_03515 [Faecalibacterium duncaniae]